MQKERLAIIVPYRNRKENMKEFLPYIQNYIKNIDYKIFIVEQANDLPFNKGILLNIGFTEAQEFDYFCFHDIDMLPIESDYSYRPNVTHLAEKVEQFDWKLPGRIYVGGVIMFDKPAYVRINGFANQFWGWGYEDDEIWYRCEFTEVPITRTGGTYRSLQHDRLYGSDLEKENLDFIDKVRERFVDGKFIDGLTTLKYKKVSEKKISERVTHIKATFELNREIKVSRVKLFATTFRKLLGKYKRQMLGQHK
jgi:hypothetical protein